MNFRFPFLFYFAIHFALPHGAALLAAPQDLVPKPKAIAIADQQPGWVVVQQIDVQAAREFPLAEKHFEIVAARLSYVFNQPIAAKQTTSDADVTVVFDSNVALEEYGLEIDESGIKIVASDMKGVAHASATLLQLAGQAKNGTLPALQIKDVPSNAYRSFMMDLGRNPHSFACLKETIDLLWFYKVDSLHLHLTDDQYFAFPSKAYPNLASEHHKITWTEFSELEQYATLRGVTIVPELEVPGHSSLLCRNYPDVFGKNSKEVATLESSRTAIKVLLDEMIELFPSSPYIHIGGDEAFGVPEEDQRNLINELAEHLKTRGKKAIVWEGPRLGSGDNRVVPDVIHINWNTTNFRADEMLAAGYPVVNAAWDPLYLVDHYPRNNFTMASPEYIYDTLDLHRFGHFDPGFSTFLDPIEVEPNEKLLGFCMPWWEGREENFFPQIVSRLIPMAEIAWDSKSPKNFNEFQRRQSTTEQIRSTIFYPVQLEVSPLVVPDDGVFHDETVVTMKSRVGAKIHYTTDGSLPTKSSPIYESPVRVSKTSLVRAVAFSGDQELEHGSRRSLVAVHPISNLALGKPVSTSATSGTPFSIGRITDGGTGNLDFYLGYPAEPKPISITIDLESRQEISSVAVHHYFNGNTFESYSIWVSQDGDKFVKVADRTEEPQEKTASQVHEFSKTGARYVRIETHGCKRCVFDSFSKITEVQVFGPSK